LLLHHYIQEFNRSAGNLEFTDEVWNYLMSYDWPGNIRELKNVLEGCSKRSENRIQISDLPLRFAATGGPIRGLRQRAGKGSIGSALHEMEQKQGGRSPALVTDDTLPQAQ